MQQSSRSSSAWISAITLIVLIVVTLLVVRSVRLAEVPSDSMLPTIKPGDIVVMRIDAYRKAMPRRGDIVIFHDKRNGEYLIKRVVGQPGETVMVWSGRVWINGERLQEDYVRGRLILELPVGAKLRDDEVWVMGDNRDFSDDSRDYGPVKRAQLVGRAAAIIWPWGRRGQLSRPSTAAK